MWVRIPLETYIFILNLSLPPRSEQVNGAVANEIKHVHSPEVIVVLDPRYELSYKALYISTCSIALSNMLYHVQSKISPYFQYKELLYISYCYTRSVASKIFNNKASLQQINFDALSQNPIPCSCSDSKYLHAPCGHIVKGDLSFVRNQKLKDLLHKGPKYRESVYLSWHQNFNITMDACEEHARRWAKKEFVEVDTLFKWVKSIANVLKRRIRRLKRSVNTRHESIFCDPAVVR